MSDPYAGRSQERGLEQTRTIERPYTNYGAANPSTYPTNVPFFRTDVGLWVFYDGTRWLTTDEHECDLQQFALNPMPYNTAAVNALLVGPSRSDRSYYVTRARGYVYVNTTNNGTNFWGFQLRDDNAVSLWAFDTSAGAVGENFFENAAINTVAAVSNYLTLTVVTHTGAPGSIGALHCVVWYRLVVP